jgi:TetR/AcrR family fatty acid metabolism transcriptional regulator
MPPLQTHRSQYHGGGRKPPGDCDETEGGVMDLKDMKLTGKKEIIIRAALEVFCEKGFHSAKMEEIAERANIGKGTIYEYFRSKESLFENAIRSGMDYFDKIVMDEAASKSTVREQLEAIIRGHIKILFRFKNLAKLFSMDLFSHMDMEKIKSLNHHDCDHHYFTERLEFVMGIIQKGAEQGEFRRIDPFAAAFTVFSSVFGAAFRMLMYPNEEMSETAMADAAINLIMNGLIIHGAEADDQKHEATDA